MAKIVMMKHPKLGIVKKGFFGFSWTTFFFGGIPALFRGDIITGAVVILLNFFTACLAGIIWAFLYNKRYTLGLLEQGYVFDDDDSVVNEAKAALGVQS